MKHRGDHAVVLLPGAAAAEEGDEEDHNPDPDDDDGDPGGRRILDLVGVVQTNLDQDADNNQGKATQLQGKQKRSVFLSTCSSELRSMFNGMLLVLLSAVVCRTETQQQGTCTSQNEHIMGCQNQD